MNQISFKIPELEAFPAERRETVLRECLESEEFGRRSRRIQMLSFVGAVTAALIVSFGFTFSGVSGEHHWVGGVVALFTVGFFIVVMIVAQIWFRARLVRRMVREQRQ